MLAVTGANGHLGSRLLLAGRADGMRALVRSARAADQVRGLGADTGADVHVVDYRDPAGLAEALAGCTAVAHLVGIIKEARAGDYRDAHEHACRALAQAAGRAGLRRIVYLSILGASPGSANPCLASRGTAEQLLRNGPVPVTVIRVPMVLGEHDFAARALAARARRRWNLVLRGASLEQPIYAGDVVDALQGALHQRGAAAGYELAGPESLTRSALVRRAAAVLGRDTRVVSLPLALGMGLAWGLERVSAQPPVTRPMLGVLDHDDCIDPAPAAFALGVRLTPLDQTLRLCIAGPATA